MNLACIFGFEMDAAIWQAEASNLSFVSGLYTFQDSNFKHTYSINYIFDCDLSSIIYLINCEKCNKAYVGSTINALLTRYYNH